MMAKLIKYVREFSGKSSFNFEYNLFMVYSSVFDLPLPVPSLNLHIYLIQNT